MHNHAKTSLQIGSDEMTKCNKNDQIRSKTKHYSCLSNTNNLQSRWTGKGKIFANKNEKELLPRETLPLLHTTNLCYNVSYTIIASQLAQHKADSLSSNPARDGGTWKNGCRANRDCS